MTFKFKNVYVENTSTVANEYESKGPLAKYFDKKYDDLYCGEKSIEKAEIRMLKDSIQILLKKTNLTKNDIDLVLSGDLNNQITSSTFASSWMNTPFLGLYNACATSMEGVIIGSCLIDGKKIKNCISATSSHNMTSEKQFRNPTEYGGPKPKTATFTSTGGASILLTSKKTDIRVESATIGRITDFAQTDPNNMGAVMAPAAADTLATHLKDLNRTPDDYDLILTGDLGYFGKQILTDFLKEEYNITLTKKNYNDCGVMLYDLKKQTEVMAGGSGPVCSALVNYSYIYKMLKEKKLKRVLLITTGALFSPTSVFQKENILSIAHAVSLEVI